MAVRGAAAKGAAGYAIEYWSSEALEFLGNLHPQKDVADRVFAKLWKKVEYLKMFGRGLDRPHAAVLHGYPGLFELRVEDESGWYRLFYGFGKRRANRVVPIALVHGVVKHEANPPEVEYARALGILNSWLAAGCPSSSRGR